MVELEFLLNNVTDKTINVCWCLAYKDEQIKILFTIGL